MMGKSRFRAYKPYQVETPRLDKSLRLLISGLQATVISPLE